MSSFRIRVPATAVLIDRTLIVPCVKGAAPSRLFAQQAYARSVSYSCSAHGGQTSAERGRRRRLSTTPYCSE